MRKPKPCPACGCHYGASIITDLREKCAELERYEAMVLEVCGELETFDEYRDALSGMASAKRQLDEAAKQEPVAWLKMTGQTYDCTATMTRYVSFGFYAETSASIEQKSNERRQLPHFGTYPDLPKLYSAPVNLPAIIEQAKAEERELCLQAIPAKRFYVQGDSSSISLIKNGWNEACDNILDAIRARKP